MRGHLVVQVVPKLERPQRQIGQRAGFGPLTLTELLEPRQSRRGDLRQYVGRDGEGGLVIARGQPLIDVKQLARVG
ncbi:MAG TPA: hypothetical protein VGI69_03665 [Gaiellaceae bacterium]